MSKTLKLEDFQANTKEWFLEQLGNMSASQALQTISDLYDELHKPTYPKTYEECCEVLSIPSYYKLKYSTYEHNYHEYTTSKKLCLLQDNLNKLGKLLICRDAYWKIAGEQMGLGKSWKPDWEDSSDKYTISFKCDKIFLNNTMWYSEMLAFPTPEIRNKFYEHFKDLIENCKELL